MLRYIILVLFLAGIKLGSCRPQKNAAEAREQITNDGIKKNEVVVNGPESATARDEEILKNFRNPVLEYLLNKNSIRNDLSERKGIVRQIQHSQTLLIPNLMNGQNLFAGTLLNQIGDLQTNHEEENSVKRDPEKTPLENFLNYVKNQETKTKEESSVTSPVLHLNKNQTEKENPQEDLTRIKVYPAVAVLINTFSKDGMLKNSVTHYQPDFEKMKNYVKEKEDLGVLLTQNQTVNLEKNLNQVQKMHYSHHINNISGNSQSQWSIEKEEKSQVHVDGETQEMREHTNTGQFRQGQITWPFAGYFPIVINDPFLTAYNAITSSMYSAFSSMIEYGPEADICRSNKDHSHKSLLPEDVKKEHEEETKAEMTKIEMTTTDTTKEKKIPEKMESIEEIKVGTEVTLLMPEEEKETAIERSDPEIFDEIRLEATKFNANKSPENNEEEIEEEAEVKEAKERKLKHETDHHRRKRETTNIFMKIKNGGMIDINVQEPDIKSELFNFDVQERSRSHSIPVVHLPPLSTVVRPQFSGYFDKRKKPKPSKPNKEENEETSEEVGEEQESSSESTGGDGVAISPPPEGASVAEAKPVGLAIAGPGGVAAAKPQGTAVAGPGGLAIARPVGTAIAGVEVEGSIPIGASKNKKKKPKQDPEKENQKEDESDLQYVGGLTGPIGNPQPKEFSDSNFFGRLHGIVHSPQSSNHMMARNGFPVPVNPHDPVYHIYLGQQQDGKYGYLPVKMAYPKSDRLQKRMDNPTYFHGLLGNNNNKNMQPRAPVYPVMYY